MRGHVDSDTKKRRTVEEKKRTLQSIMSESKWRIFTDLIKIVDFKTQTYHHHEWRNPGGSPNVMFFSHRILTQTERETERGASETSCLTSE